MNVVSFRIYVTKKDETILHLDAIVSEEIMRNETIYDYGEILFLKRVIKTRHKS